MKKTIIILAALAILLLAGDLVFYFLFYQPNSIQSLNHDKAGIINTNVALANLTNLPTADDTDGDGLPNTDEAIAGTDPNVFDTDMDGYPDGLEVSSGHKPLAGTGFVFYNQSNQPITPSTTQNINGTMTTVVELQDVQPLLFTDVSLEFFLYDKCVEVQDYGAQFGSKGLADGKTYEYCQLPAGEECNPKAFLFNQCVFRPATISTSERQSINSSLAGYQAQFSCGGEYSFSGERIYGIEKQNGFYLVYALGELKANQDAVYLLILNSNFQVTASYYDGEIPLVPEVKADGTLANPTGILYC